MLQGEPTAYYFNNHCKNSRHRVAEICNYIGYDVAVIGNHDIEMGKSIFNKFTEECNYPILGANVIDTQTNEPYFQQHLKYQTRHMQLLTRWCLGVMDMLEGRQGAKEAACASLEQLLEARTVLEQGEWKHWHRGDKKINIQLLLDMTKAWN